MKSVCITGMEHGRNRELICAYAKSFALDARRHSKLPCSGRDGREPQNHHGVRKSDSFLVFGLGDPQRERVCGRHSISCRAKSRPPSFLQSGIGSASVEVVDGETFRSCGRAKILAGVALKRWKYPLLSSGSRPRALGCADRNPKCRLDHPITKPLMYKRNLSTRTPPKHGATGR